MTIDTLDSSDGRVLARHARGPGFESQCSNQKHHEGIIETEAGIPRDDESN